MKKNLTKELYESPIRERNIEKHGDMGGCICCGKPMKEGEALHVHMNEDWVAVSNEVTEENCKELTGHNSQGYFPVGNSCAKKMGKKFTNLL